ncbi:MAG: allantoinase AllB [Propionibacteriaceae bacterium]
MSQAAPDRQPTFDLVIRADRAIVGGVEQAASVAVQDGTIVDVAAIDVDWVGEHELRLAPDEVLLPGLVDTHVHVNEPGRTEWEGFESATKAALRGGITTILDMPLNSLPPTVDADALAVKRKAADGQSFVDVGFWGGAIPGNLGDLAALHDAGVFGFKSFLIDSGVPEFPPLSATDLPVYMAALAELDALLIVHAEDPDAMAAAPPAQGRRYADFLASRPEVSENTAIEHVIAAARATGCRSHILHLSSAEALPALRAAKAELALTVETCPHYLSLHAESIADGQTAFKCCPPIRGDHNRDALWAGLADGTIDCVVSDHSPCVPELKDLEGGDFGRAWGGVASLQISLPVVWTEAARRGHTVADVVGWMAEAPARLAGLDHKGRIEVGRQADFAVFAPDDVFTVDPPRLEHRNPVSPYAGHELRGVVRSTWLRGQQLDTDTPTGRLLTRPVR